MIVVPGKKRAHRQRRSCRRIDHLPAQHCERRAVNDKNLLLDFRAVFENEAPLGPRLTGECDDPSRPIGMHDAGRIAM
jgi:hypothetical protein